jgi:L-2-hydroxyglutarate oxidase
MPTYDVAIVGGGAVGLATAYALSCAGFPLIAVLEAEPTLAAHQTGNNSGVIHSGLYYKPGSLKAANCTAGREALYRFCAEHGVAHERCGKLVVATEERELPALEELIRRGTANGLDDLRRLGPEELREHEPHVAGIAGIWVKETGIVDYKAVARTLARLVSTAGGSVLTDWRMSRLERRTNELVLISQRGAEVRARMLVNCAGLQSDRVAMLCGLTPTVRICPFRGEYYELVPERQHLVRNLIYPVPDPRFPFLGVHFTRMIGGGVEAGPNAVLAYKREGYRHRDVSIRDLWSLATWPGFWSMATTHARTGLGEMYRSLVPSAFAQALARLVPEVRLQDLRRAGAGVRAQALGRDGKLLDDFHIITGERMVHVLNAPSPAATACLTIGESIAGEVRSQLTS